MFLLPDDAFLVIFEFLLDSVDNVDGWHTLIHVCQQWRNVILSSPRRLNLRILCTGGRPVREMLDIWPAFPITIQDYGDTILLDGEADNIIAALEHPGRVGEIRLVEIPSSLLEIFAAAMKEPFPMLTTLELQLDHGGPRSVLPDSFFGAVPRLRVLDLTGLPFSAVRNLLLSTSELVYLCLWDMPISGNASEPKEIVTCLSAMTKLESIELGFCSSFYPYRASRHTLPPPLTRVLLPALTHFWFQGDSGYLGDLMAHLDTPLLDGVSIIKPYWGISDSIGNSPHLSLDSFALG